MGFDIEEKKKEGKKEVEKMWVRRERKKRQIKVINQNLISTSNHRTYLYS